MDLDLYSECGSDPDPRTHRIYRKKFEAKCKV